LHYVILNFTVKIYVSEHGNTTWTCFHCDDIYGDKTCDETISCAKATYVSLIKYNVPCKHLISVRCRADIPFYIGLVSALMSVRYRMGNTARCRTDVGCILNNHIGPMSSRPAFPHRPDIGFLPRSDISRRHFADILMSAQYRMCNTARCNTDVGCILNNHTGLMSNRLAFPYRPHISF